MQALHIPNPGARAVAFSRDYPAPAPGAGEVLIRVRLGGICATDLELVRGYMGFAGVPGHEFVGEVLRGPEALLGRRVVGEINCPCGTCAVCRRGLAHHCPQRTVLGIAGRDGAFAELLVLPAANCHPVPDGVSDEQAVFVEPLAAAVHALDGLKLERGTRLAVLGSGRLGLLVAQVAALYSADSVLIGRNPRSLALAQRRGLPTLPVNQAVNAGVYEVVIDCTGCPEGLRTALRLCRPCGTIVLKSTYAEPAPIDLAPVVVNEIRVLGSRCGDFAPALRLLAEQRVHVTDLVSAEYPLAEGVAAFAAANRPDNIKVLLRMPS